MLRRATGFAAFIWVAIGQTVSIFGTRMADFAIAVWTYQTTGSVTRFSLVMFFAVAPSVLFSPVAGILADRWNRRTLLILSDVGMGSCSLLLVFAFRSENVEFGYLLFLVGLGSTFASLHYPAFLALIPQLVPKGKLERANGISSFSDALATLLGPFCGGILIAWIDIRGILLIDCFSFLFSMLVFLFISVPSLKREGPAQKFDLVTAYEEIREGWHYLRARNGLMALMCFSVAFNFTFGMIQVLVNPLVLSFSTAKALGTILSVAGTGMLIGGLIMMTVGSLRRKMVIILSLSAFQGFALGAGGLHRSLWLIGVGTFLFMLAQPVVLACRQTLWQTKIPQEIQGRVFSILQMVAMAALPVASLTAGPLADHLFEPLLSEGGLLASSVGEVIGIGPGRGVGLMFTLLGIGLLTASIVGRSYKPLWNLDEELQDAI